MSDFPGINLVAQDDAGNIINDVEIELRRDIPGQPLAVMYADRAGAVSLGSTHIFPDGSDIRFHVKTGGAFQIKATAAGFEKIWRYVGISRGQENDIVFLSQVAPWDSETTFGLGGLASIADGGNIYLFVSRVAGNLNNAPSFDGETGEPEDSEHWLFAGTMPTGPQGAAFQPVYIVPAIADRADYDAGDAGSAFTEFPPGSGQFARISVLVESDSGNDGEPTLYFLQEADTGDGATWSAGFTFAPSGASGSAVNIAARAGSFDVWQRGAGAAASIAVAASATAYTADGWYLKTGSDQASVVAAVGGIADGSNLAAKVQRNSGQTGTGAMYFAMPLDTDELALMRGKHVCLSFTAKAGDDWSPSSGTLSFAVYVGTGAVGKRNSSAYTGETTVLSGSVDLTTGAVRYEETSANAVPSNITQAEIQFTWTPSGTAGSDDAFIVDDLQLEPVKDANAGATKFAQLDYSAQLTKCERHFQKSTVRGTAIGAASDATGAWVVVASTIAHNSYYMPIRFTTRMRVAPSVTTYPFTTPGNTGRGSNSGGTDYGANSANVGVAYDFGFFIRNTSGGDLTITNNLVIVNWYADASI